MNLPIFCKEFFDEMDARPQHFGEKAKKERARIERSFATEEIHVDLELYENYLGIGKYFGYGKGYPWERCVLGLTLCCFKPDGSPRWKNLFCCFGRGAGKDGAISWISTCLISPYNKIEQYDVDIFATSEDQALRPVNDIYEMLESNPKKMKRFFKWTKEKITGLKNRGSIRGHANNAKAKDGLRSGAVIFNEVHAYENNKQIDVATTGLGKKPHPRKFFFTTNGNVDEGPFDEYMKAADEILDNPDLPDGGWLYFVFQLDSKEEAYEEENWHKANPSLIYNPGLLDETREEFEIWKKNPAALPAFMTKRMNIRQSDQKLPVATKEQIMATNKPIPFDRIAGSECIAGIDYSTVNDWTAANLHFLLDDGTRVDLNHAWVCKQGDKLRRLRCPWQEWANAGDITVVDEPTISPSLITDWLWEMSAKYYVKTVCVDSFRYELLANELRSIGFTAEAKNLRLYRPSDVMRVSPLISKCFIEERFIWGDKPYLRWATNNTTLEKTKRSKLAESGSADLGNYIYGKVEPVTRKTDPFMAIVASMTEERQLNPLPPMDLDGIGCLTF